MKKYVAKINDSGNIAVDDTILVKDVEAKAGSLILKGFVPQFSAEAVTRLENNGYIISGKTDVGEFGLDLLGEFSHYKDENEELFGAAASLVKAGDVLAGLGVDASGAPRRAAAISGIDFLKPTYGTVSRYGIISTAASGEQLGVYAKDAEKIAEIMSTVAGHDEKDGTSLREKNYSYSADMDVKGKKVLVIKELLDKADDEVKLSVKEFIENLRANGVTVCEISSDLFETANIAWQILMTAETCNNISRYDGVKFGYRAEQYRNIDELYVNSRTEGLNFLTKSVILYGSDVLSKNRYKDCYQKSLKVRRVVFSAFDEMLNGYDAVITPVCSKKSFKKYDIKDAFAKVFAQNEFTAIANLIGVPALSSGMVQITGKHFDESLILSLASSVERMGK